CAGACAPSETGRWSRPAWPRSRSGPDRIRAAWRDPKSPSENSGPVGATARARRPAGATRVRVDPRVRAAAASNGGLPVAVQPAGSWSPEPPSIRLRESSSRPMPPMRTARFVLPLLVLAGCGGGDPLLAPATEYARRVAFLADRDEDEVFRLYLAEYDGSSRDLTGTLGGGGDVLAY